MHHQILISLRIFWLICPNALRSVACGMRDEGFFRALALRAVDFSSCLMISLHFFLFLCATVLLVAQTTAQTAGSSHNMWQDVSDPQAISQRSVA